MGKGGGNRTSPTKYKGRTREFQIKPLRNLSTLNDYVASRVQINLHRTQIKKNKIKDRKMRETKPILPL